MWLCVPSNGLFLQVLVQGITLNPITYGYVSGASIAPKSLFNHAAYLLQW